MTPAELNKEYERIAKSGGYISPSPSDVHINSPLTNISVAMMQDPMGFVADRAFPYIGVPKRSDSYFVIPRGSFNRDEMKERAPGTESAGSGYEVESASYECKVWALHKNIDDQTRANYDMPLSADREATEFLTNKGRIRKERLWAGDYMADSVWTFIVTGVTGNSSINNYRTGTNNLKHWSDANSDPIEDMRGMKRGMLEWTGVEPNVFVMGRPVYDALLDHPDIVGRIDQGQTSGAAMANKAVLMQLLELDDILVMNAVYNTAKKGADDSHSFIGGKNGVLLHRPPRPGIMTPAAGYTFGWNGLLGGSAMATRISRFRMEHLKADRVEIEMAFVQKLVSADLGMWVKTIVA